MLPCRITCGRGHPGLPTGHGHGGHEPSDSGSPPSGHGMVDMNHLIVDLRHLDMVLVDMNHLIVDLHHLDMDTGGHEPSDSGSPPSGHGTGGAHSGRSGFKTHGS